MQKNNNITKLVLLIVVSTLLSGCSLVYFHYFRNYTDKPVEIIFTRNNYYEKKQFLIPFKNELLPINKKTYKNLNDSLQVNDFPGHKEKVYVIAPPNSTILLPRWGVYRTDTFFLRQGNRLDSISIFTAKGNITSFKFKKQGFPPAHFYYYDYK